MRSLYSDKNGNFEFTIVKPIDVIEVKFIGKLTLKIIGIDIYKEVVKDFFLKIPLFDNPFRFINYEKEPTLLQRQMEKEKRKLVLNGIRLDCNDKAKIKYSKKEDCQFVKFIDLINCKG